jgi:ABC-type dipeptide/oligopeptide/nickel transport system ATPase component
VLDEPRHPYTRALLMAVPRRGWKPVRSRFLETQTLEEKP